MINRLYNPWQITNSGEREADRHFALSKGKEDELISIVHQLRISSRFHKTHIRESASNIFGNIERRITKQIISLN